MRRIVNLKRAIALILSLTLVMANVQMAFASEIVDEGKQTMLESPEITGGGEAYEALSEEDISAESETIVETIVETESETETVAETETMSETEVEVSSEVVAVVEESSEEMTDIFGEEETGCIDVEIDGTHTLYESLGAAASAINASDYDDVMYIKILEDFDETGDIEFDKAASINLNGKTVSIEGTLRFNYDRDSAYHTGNVINVNGGKLTVTEDLIMQSGELTLNKGQLEVNNLYMCIVNKETDVKTEGYCSLFMENSNDRVVVVNDVVLSRKLTLGDYSGIHFKNGTMTIGGDFSLIGDEYVAGVDDAHKVLFTPGKAHTIDISDSRPIVAFGSIGTTDGSKLLINAADTFGFVKLLSDVDVHSARTIMQMTSMTYLNGKTLNIDTSIKTDANSVDIQQGALYVDGDISILGLSYTSTFDANGGNLSVNGLFTSGSSYNNVVLKANKGSIYFKGSSSNLGISIRMNNKEDEVFIDGDWTGASDDDELHNGTLTVTGDITGKEYDDIVASADHTLVLDGSSTQKIDISPSSCFGAVKIGPNGNSKIRVVDGFGFMKLLSDIEIYSDMYPIHMSCLFVGENNLKVDGSVELIHGSSDQHLPTEMIKMNGGSILVEDDLTLKHSELYSYRDDNVIGRLDNGLLEVAGTLSIPAGYIALNGGTLRAGELVSGQSGSLVMKNAKDKVYITGDLYVTGSNYQAPEMTNGELYIGGDLIAEDGVFVATKNHKTILNAPAGTNQTVQFYSRDSKFNYLYVPDYSSRKIIFKSTYGSDRAESTYYVKLFKDGIDSNDYGIEYELYGGVQNDANPTSYVAGATTKLLAPTRTGYIFKGWYESEEAARDFISTSKVSDLTGLKGDVIFYAGWDPITYTIAFDKNGGRGQMASYTVKYDELLRLEDHASTFTRTGYTFAGWNTKKNGTGTGFLDKEITESAPNLTTKKNATVILYAQWTANTYNVYYANIVEEDINDNPATRVMNEKVTLKNPVRAGYVFKGWYKNAEFTGKPVKQIAAATASDVSVYAKWIERKYSVVYNKNLPSGERLPDEMVWPGATLVEGATPAVAASLGETVTTKSGLYSFMGWNTAKNGKGVSISALDSVNDLTNGSKITLYAQWRAKGCNIVYNSANTAGIRNSNPVWGTIIADITLKAPAKTGYIFGGWYSDELLTSKITKIKKADIAAAFESGDDINVYAKWTPVVYTVKFNKNGGAGAIDAIKCTYDESKALTVNTGKITRTGYEFQGWATKKTASVAAYSDGSDVLNLKASDGAVATLYAVWAPIDYDVNYVSIVDGEVVEDFIAGADNPNPATHIYAKAVNLKKPSRKGYVFKGWYTTAAMNRSCSQVPKNLANRFTVYGKWIRNSYRIIYSPNGATATSRTFDGMKSGVGVTIKSSLFTRSGYTLVGWSTSMRGSAEDMNSADPVYTYYAPGQEVSGGFIANRDNAALHLYAVWEEN